MARLPQRDGETQPVGQEVGVTLDRVQDDPAQRPPVITDLHKFALTPQGPDYRGSGSVQGHLGWEADKRPFRLSDHEGVLRVATSLGETWDDTSTTRLSLLRETPDSDAASEAETVRGP